MREDLLQLDRASLELLSNRGLVKRALRMIDKGQGPVITEEESGALTATFPDGAVATWRVAVAIGDVACSCGATSICHHAVCVPLALQASASALVPADEAPWTPPWDDAMLIEHLGARAVRRARSILEKGVNVEVCRGPRPQVNLPNGTVVFVAHSLELVHCDVAGQQRGPMVVLAVWACREAEGADSDIPVVAVHLGGSARVRGHDALDACHALVDRVATAGVANVPVTLAALFEHASREARRDGCVWIGEAMSELQAQIQAHRARDARYAPGQAAALLGELAARRRAVLAQVPPSPDWFLGAGVAAETDLKHLTLVGLGARVRAVGAQIDVDVYLFDPQGGVVLTLSRCLDGAALGNRRVGRLGLGALAAGQLTTMGAKRSANRQLRLASEASNRQHLLNVADGDWLDLPAPVRIYSVPSFAHELLARPPVFLRPRLRAEDVRIVAIGGLAAAQWLPGAQRLVAWGHTADGHPLRVQLAHDRATPGACASLESCLPQARFLAGHVRFEGELLVIEPTAVSVPGEVIVPAFAASAPVQAPTTGAAVARPIAEALDAARDALAELAHHGVNAPRPSVEVAAKRLQDVGLIQAAARLRNLGTVQGWVDAWLTVALARGRR